MDALPNLLVLSQEIPQMIHAGSILLYRLLKDYPPEKLLVLGQAVHPKAARLACRYEPLPRPGQRLDFTRLAAWRSSLRALGLFPTVSDRAITRRLGAFRPQVVLSVMETDYPWIAHRFARRRNLPLAVIVHDRFEFFANLYPWAAGAERKRSKACYLYARTRLCVSPEMEEYLRSCWGVGGEVLYPNRAEELAPRPRADARALKEPGVLRVGYAGSLSYGYSEQLQAMMASFRAASAKLMLYVNERPAWADPEVVMIRGFAATPMETWTRIQQECDVVILPYCWTGQRNQELYRTHFPSKLTEYVALGMPVLILGPEYATGVRWGLRNPGAAMVVTQGTEAAWTAALRQLREDGALRESLAASAWSCGQRDFDPVAIRQSFLAHLVRAAGGVWGADAEKK